MRHGYGAWAKLNSQFHYSGMWSNNKPWGYGILKSHIGDVYEGLFHNGFKHGTGVEVFKNGGSYIGNYRDGVPHGHGKLIAFDGSIFKGLFAKGLKHGNGSWTIPITEEIKKQRKMITTIKEEPNAHYTGPIIDGKLCGNGKETWSTGVEYVGEFLNNRRHGRGRMIQRDGTVYEGFWENGKASGVGVLIQKDGFKNYGLFKDNTMVSKLDLEQYLRFSQKKPDKKRKLTPKTATRCKSAVMTPYNKKHQQPQYPQTAKVTHRFSRRPMLNKLMNTLTEKTHNRESNSDIGIGSKSSKMSTMKFKYR